MVRVDWAEPALDDLRQVHEFIARDSARYAQRTIERITNAARRLARFPEMGEVILESGDRAYRQTMIGVYRLIYRFDSDNSRVIVLAVVHASRNLPPILDNLPTQ